MKKEGMKVTKDTPDLSGMMRHYLTIKEQYPDCVVFYRLGDFYEMFFDDAVEVSALLELTLTGRDCGLKERAPMCGVPFHAADSYIARLVSLGKKVAVCEQLSDPATTKGLVERDVVRIVTGGTVTEDKYVDERSNNFIFVAAKIGEYYSLSWADITTGEFYCKATTSFKETIDFIITVNPAEILVNEDMNREYLSLSEGVRSSFCTPRLYKENAFGKKESEKTLCEHFEVRDASLIIDVGNRYALSAAGALLSYLIETQRHVLKNLQILKYYDDGKYLKLDITALRNLEILKSMRQEKYGSLLWAIDKTVTAGGGRRLKQMLVSPLRNVDAVNYRLDGVEDLFSDNLTREAIVETLRSVKDLARLCGRISNGIVNPRDCTFIRETLACAPVVKIQLAGMKAPVLRRIAEAMGDFSSLETLIGSMIDENPHVSLKDGNFIRDGFDEELDKYRYMDRNARKIIKDMEEREREATGIRTLKISYNKIFGYYIEISNSFKDKVPYNYIRRQTLVNGERFVTEELKKIENDVLTSSERAIKIENELFDKLKGVLIEHLGEMLELAKAFSTLDVLCSFATVARQRNYCRPEIVGSDKPLNIVGGRHAVVEAGAKGKFVPNDTYLNMTDDSMMIITGPNMAGKSTYMRQVALIVLLAQVGSFVPAKDASIPIVDRIFTRVGASDNLLFDQSTFMVEMTEVASVLRNATENSLVILDEVGRGTSTFDGLSIAWAVVEYLVSEKKVKTLFATHYHELTELERQLVGVKNYKITVKEINGEIVFLRKIQKGSVNRSFGIEVAALAGVPEKVTANAKKILKRLEKNDLVLANETQEQESAPQPSFVEEYLKKLDLNVVTPLKAFEILSYLKEKTDGEN